MARTTVPQNLIDYVFRSTIDDMRAITAPRNDSAVLVQAAGVAGMYVFDATDTAAPNNTTTFSAADATPGLWKQRLVAGAGGGSAGPWTDIDDVISDLSGRITSSELAASLTNRIDLIDASSATEQSVAWYVAQEASARTQAVADLAASVGAVNAAVLSNAAQLGAFGNSLNLIDAEVTGLESGLGLTNASVASLVSDFGSFESEFDTAQAAITALEGQLTTAAGDITTLGGAVTTLTGGLNTVNGELSALASQVADLSATPDFDAAQAWDIGDIVKWEGGLYQAIQNMTPTSPLPSNTAYWDLIGNYDSLGQAVIALSGEVEDLEGNVTAIDGRATALETAVNNPTTGLSSRALTTTVNSQIATVYGAAVSSFGQISARFTSTDQAVNARALTTTVNSQIATVYGAAVENFAQINTRFNATDANIAARATISSLNSAVTSIYGASVSAFTNINARFTSVEADVNTRATQASLNTAISNVYGAAVSAFTNIEARFEAAESDIDTKAGVTEVNTAIASAQSAAVATATAQIYTSLGGNQAAVETKAESWDGVAAQWGVKTQVGDLVGGIGLFNDGVNTKAMVLADQFSVWDGEDPVVPFIVQGGSVYINSAFINELSVNKLAAGTLGIQINMGSGGRIVYDNGVVMKVEGLGFGTSNQFIEWFGPRTSGGNIALCSEANATSYKKTNGDMYTGGSFTAGLLTNGAQTTLLSAPPIDLEVGAFGSNGNTITVACSIQVAASVVSASPIAGQPTCTLQLYRRLGSGSETLVRTQAFTGTRVFLDSGGEPGVDSIVGDSISSSFTYTDPTLSTSNRTYRLRLSQRSVVATPNVQVLGFQSTESP